MNKGQVVLVLCIALLTLTGCATTKVMNGIMSSWDGEHVDSVVSQWGYPDEERTFRDKKLYLWHHQKSGYIPQSTTTQANVIGSTVYANSQTSGGHTIHGNCTRILEVNNEGYVTRWEWKGNNCPFAEMMEYSRWRKKN